MAAGGSGNARLTDSKPRTTADRQPSRLSASEGMLNPSTRVSPPRNAPNFRLVPPASSVITMRRSFSNGIGIFVAQALVPAVSRLRTPDVAPELRAVEEDKLTHSSQRPIVTVVIAGNSSRINRRNILQHRSFKGTYAEAGQKCFPESPGRRWAYHWPVERELTPGSTRSGVRSLRTPDVAPELRAVEEDKLTHSSQRPIVTVVIAGNSSRINRRNILQHRSFKGTYAE